MPVESATYINELNPATIGNTTDPTEGGAQVSLVKQVLVSSFPNIAGEVTATNAELNYLDITTLGTAQASKALTVSAGSAINATGITWTTLGTVTTADINGGTIDGTVIGGASAAAGSFTTVAASSNGTFGGTLTVTGIQTLTGATTCGTSLTLATGATVTEFSIDGTLAGNSDAAVPTEKAVKTYVDALDFATEAYVDGKSRYVMQLELNPVASTADTDYFLIPVTGTVVRFDVLTTWPSSPEALTVTLETAAFGAMASVTTSVTTSPSISSDTSITNDAVTAGSYLITKTGAPSAGAGNAVVRVVLTVAI